MTFSDGIMIEAPHFTVMVVLGEEGYVIRTPPIVRYMNGWSERKVRDYCAQKGWVIRE